MGELLRILQIEDSESDAALVVRLFKRAEYEIRSERVEDAAAMREALANREFDVVISDYQLPQFGAPEALRIRNEAAPELPFIVVSGTIGEDRAVELVRAGAGDYILKDRIARLVPAVQRELREAQSRAEHRLVKERLHDQDEWLALAVASTRLGMFDFYPRSQRLVLSESGRHHVGLPAGREFSLEEVIGALHPDDRERIHGLVRKAFSAEGAGEFIADCRLIGVADSVERWLAAQGRVLFDPEGRPIRFVGVTIDITERKQFESRLTMLDRAKTDFLNLISHEFRTPLNGILGVGDLILERMPASESGDKLREVFQTGRRRILSMLDDASLLAQLDANSEQFKCSLVSLQQALNCGIESAIPFTKNRGVVIAPAPAIPDLVWANERLLARALHALLETAVKFSEKGETVTFSTCAPDQAPSIVIESHGRTVPGPLLASFFDILSIGEAITPGGDLGLRAPVASRILALFGASVSVVNREPAGIALTISLKNASPNRGD